jgi:hypothetical protein
VKETNRREALLERRQLYCGGGSCLARHLDCGSTMWSALSVWDQHNRRASHSALLGLTSCLIASCKPCGLDRTIRHKCNLHTSPDTAQRVQYNDKSQPHGVTAYDVVQRAPGPANATPTWLAIVQLHRRHRLSLFLGFGHAGRIDGPPSVCLFVSACYEGFPITQTWEFVQISEKDVQSEASRTCTFRSHTCADLDEHVSVIEPHLHFHARVGVTPL